MDVWVVWCLAIMRGVTTHVFFGARVFPFLLRNYQEVELPGSRVCSALQDTDKLFSQVVSLLTFPAAARQNANCSTLLSTFGIFSLFHFSSLAGVQQRLARIAI